MRITLKSSLRENNKIQEELAKYSWNTIEEFQRVLPAHTLWGTMIEVFPKEGFDHLCYLWLCEEPDIDPYQDFWERWTRFLNLRAFL